MKPAPATDDILGFLARLYKDGDINHFIQVWEKNQDGLWDVLPEILETSIAAIQTTPSIVAPETWRRLEKLVRSFDDPTQLKSFSAIRKKGKTPPKAKIGFLWIPVFSTYGHVLGLRVTDRGSEEIGKDRLKLLDEVGSAVYSALRARLPLHGFLPWRPDRFSFQIVNVFGEERTDVDGRSLTLPLALALYSRAFLVPIPACLSASANVRRNGAIGGVEAIGEKLAALQRERPFITQVLVADGQKDLPSPTVIEIKPCKHIEDALERVFGSSFPPDLTRFAGLIDVHDEAHALQKLYKDRLYDTCIENATAIIGYLNQSPCPLPQTESIRALFTAHWRRGSCHCHQGDADRSLADFTKAQGLSGRHKGIVRPDEYLNSQISLAVLLKDLFRYREAETIHRSVATDLAKGIGTDQERMKNEGSWSQLCLAMGRFAEAETKQRLAISLNRKGGDLYRNYNYLGHIYTGCGLFPQAKAALDKANRLLSSATYLNQSTRAKDRAYLDLYRAEYLYRYGSTLKRRKGIFEELLAIHKAVAANQTWIRPLTWKWVALGLLWEEEKSDRGLALLAEACAYYAGQSESVLKLLEVTTRAERVLHRLGHVTSNVLTQETLNFIREDIKAITACLRLNPDIQRYFHKEIKALETLNTGKTVDRKRMQENLTSLCAKIPY